LTSRQPYGTIKIVKEREMVEMGKEYIRITLVVKKGQGYASVIDMVNNAGYTLLDGYTDMETDDYILVYSEEPYQD
jgi:hypothetical protein